MTKTYENDLTQQTYHLLKVAGFDVQYETLVTNKPLPKMRLIVRSEYGNPIGLIEVSLPNKNGIISPNNLNTGIPAVPYHVLTSLEEVLNVVSLFE